MSVNLPVSCIVIQHPVVVSFGGADHYVGTVHGVEVELRNVLVWGEVAWKVKTIETSERNKTSEPKYTKPAIHNSASQFAAIGNTERIE